MKDMSSITRTDVAAPRGVHTAIIGAGELQNLLLLVYSG